MKDFSIGFKGFQAGFNLAGRGGEPAVDIAALFKASLYTGTSANQDIVSNLDFNLRAGLVWLKARNSVGGHRLFDTLRGVGNELSSDTTGAEFFRANSLTAFNNDGFSLGNYAGTNGSGGTYAAWQFMQQAKFFNVIEYTGNGAASNPVAHGLGIQCGLVLVKNKATGAWTVMHLSAGTDTTNLNATDTFSALGRQQFTMDATNFYPTGGNAEVNVSAADYIAYAFAHDVSDEGVIQCGEYTGDGISGLAVSLGWQPQFVLIKSRDTVAGRWFLFDAARGGGNLLSANSTATETTFASIGFNVDGFTVDATHGEINTNGAKYVYMAIKEVG